MLLNITMHLKLIKSPTQKKSQKNQRKLNPGYKYQFQALDPV